MSWLARKRSWLGVATITVAIACTSPTLPLPPPAAPSVSVGSTPETFHLSSDRGALPNALVITVNRNEALPADKRVDGTIADANGSWEMDVFAKPGDFVDISQENGEHRSPVITVEMK